MNLLFLRNVTDEKELFDRNDSASSGTSYKCSSGCTIFLKKEENLRSTNYKNTPPKFSDTTLYEYLRGTLCTETTTKIGVLFWVSDS